jgi:hypothetical protein
MSGRPCSIKEMVQLARRLYAVPPNRLISMNDYRVGSWYPGATDTGRFNDKKSMVAVGALIAYLAESGRLPMFRLNTEDLKLKIQPTTDYIGFMNIGTETLEQLIVTPDNNYKDAQIAALPIHIGSKQINVSSYPTHLLYVLDFNEGYIRKCAIENLRHQSAESPPVDAISRAMEAIITRTKSGIPFSISFVRNYPDAKEELKIEAVLNSLKDDVPQQRFKLSYRSWTEDQSNWLDSGMFILYFN